VLGRIFGPKRDEATEEWRRLHNKELCALYSSANIIRETKSRRLRQAGHAASMGKISANWVFVGKPQGRRPPDTGVDERIILKWTFEKWNEGIDWIDLAQDRDRWRAFVNAVMTLRLP
jgi:hypothetical protein